MKELSGTFTSKGQLVIPAELRRKHKIKAGTKVKFFEDEFGRIILQPITEDYIHRAMGFLADGPDYLAIWEKEHRAEKDFCDKVAERREVTRSSRHGWSTRSSAKRSRPGETRGKRNSVTLAL